jgi:hypothetical protein
MSKDVRRWEVQPACFSPCRLLVWFNLVLSHGDFYPHLSVTHQPDLSAKLTVQLSGCGGGNNAIYI